MSILIDLIEMRESEMTFLDEICGLFIVRMADLLVQLFPFIKHIT